MIYATMMWQIAKTADRIGIAVQAGMLQTANSDVAEAALAPSPGRLLSYS
jgi:hypothetical protein